MYPLTSGSALPSIPQTMLFHGNNDHHNNMDLGLACLQTKPKKIGQQHWMNKWMHIVVHGSKITSSKSM